MEIQRDESRTRLFKKDELGQQKKPKNFTSGIETAAKFEKKKKEEEEMSN